MEEKINPAIRNNFFDLNLDFWECLRERYRQILGEILIECNKVLSGMGTDREAIDEFLMGLNEGYAKFTRRQVKMQIDDFSQIILKK